LVKIKVVILKHIAAQFLFGKCLWFILWMRKPLEDLNFLGPLAYLKRAIEIRVPAKSARVVAGKASNGGEKGDDDNLLREEPTSHVCPWRLRIPALSVARNF
jgi:hypothetical protein